MNTITHATQGKILDLLAQGLTNLKIAQQLGLDTSIVGTHATWLLEQGFIPSRLTKTGQIKPAFTVRPPKTPKTPKANRWEAFLWEGRRAGRTYEDLAAEMGCTKQYVAQLLKGIAARRPYVPHWLIGMRPMACPHICPQCGQSNPNAHQKFCSQACYSTWAGSHLTDRQKGVIDTVERMRRGGYRWRDVALKLTGRDSYQAASTTLLHYVRFCRKVGRTPIHHQTPQEGGVRYNARSQPIKGTPTKGTSI